jgi:hypothetical protein
MAQLVTRRRAGRPGFDSRQGKMLFIFTTVPRPSLGPTTLLVQWVQGVKWSGRGAIRVCIQKLLDWPPGARTGNGTALCH